MRQEMACKCGHLPEDHGMDRQFAEIYNCTVKMADGSQCPCADYRPSHMVDVLEGYGTPKPEQRTGDEPL